MTHYDKWLHVQSVMVAYAVWFSMCCIKRAEKYGYSFGIFSISQIKQLDLGVACSSISGSARNFFGSLSRLEPKNTVQCDK